MAKTCLLDWYIGRSLSPEASVGIRVLSLPSVCLCVCSCVRLYVYQLRACLCENSSPDRARITKFGQEMQNNLVRLPIVLGAIDLDCFMVSTVARSYHSARDSCVVFAVFVLLFGTAYWSSQPRFFRSITLLLCQECNRRRDTGATIDRMRYNEITAAMTKANVNSMKPGDAYARQ